MLCHHSIFSRTEAYAYSCASNSICSTFMHNILYLFFGFVRNAVWLHPFMPIHLIDILYAQHATLRWHRNYFKRLLNKHLILQIFRCSCSLLNRSNSLTFRTGYSGIFPRTLLQILNAHSIVKQHSFPPLKRFTK